MQYALSRIRNAARMLLTLDEKNSRRIFEGEALLRRMNRYGLLDESQNKLSLEFFGTSFNFFFPVVFLNSIRIGHRIYATTFVSMR